MTSPLRISFSLVLLAAAAWGANVTGSVELAESRESSVRKKRNFSGVALWLEPLASPPSLPASTLTITQKDKKFSPHVSIAPTGVTVDGHPGDPGDLRHLFEGHVESVRLEAAVTGLEDPDPRGPASLVARSGHPFRGHRCW